MSETKEKLKKKDDKFKNVVFVGAKPFMNYINAVDFQLRSNPKVIIRARGKFIARAADVSQVMKNRYNAKIEEIKLDSSEFENKEGKGSRVSEIDIIITK